MHQLQNTVSQGKVLFVVLYGPAEGEDAKMGTLIKKEGRKRK